MGMATHIFGCIIEYGLQVGEMQLKINAHNQQVIEDMPLYDNWPPLSRNMFAITSAGIRGETPTYDYGGRIIHFGANLKGVEMEWSEWKEKFESLLTKLLWTRAHVHFVTEYNSLQSFEWRIDLLKWSLRGATELKSISPEHWKFTPGINNDWK
jgi:hypothetical protein